MKNLKKFNHTENADSFSTSVDEFYTPPIADVTSSPFGDFALKALQIRDQAHIFHWQTHSFAEHEAFGSFYEGYLEELDDLIEMIMGILDRPRFGTSTIQVKDHSVEAITEFFNDCRLLFCEGLEKICDDDKHEEIFDQARLVLARIDKLKYLLTLR